MRRRSNTTWPVVAALAAVALLAGCTCDTCTCPDDGGHIEYPDQSTPDNVIGKLAMAYENMDADEYMECLAEEFLFSLNPDDVAGDATLPPYWDKSEERMLHWHMFADTTVIESISLTLTVVSTDSLPGDDPVDPSDDLWEYEVNVDLRVQAGVTYLSSGMALFVMRRSSDHLDTVWQIIEHHDLGGDHIQREDTTWTAIKLALGGPAADSLYPLRTSPVNVINKLVLAYVRMDAEAYLDCLAEDFIFFLNPDDLTDYPELPAYWDKVEEATIHGNMFAEDTDVERIALVFTGVSTSYDDAGTGDPFDDTWVFLEDIDLRIQLPPDLTLHAQAPEQFTLGVDPDETGHGGELLWEIRRWYDISEEGGRGPDPMVEDASWGTIKAIYR